MSNESLSVFEKFIEEVLNLDGLPPIETSPRKEFPHVANYPDLRKHIREIWNDLTREKPGPHYWLHHLTPLEQDTRRILADMIFKTVRQNFGKEPSDEEMKAIITYSISLAWLVLNALLDTYSTNDGSDDIELPPDMDFFF